MSSLRTSVESGIPGAQGLPAEETPVTVDDNRMPRITVDPFGLIYKPDPTVEFLYVVPDSNFQGDVLAEDPHLGTLKAAVLDKTDEPEEPPVEPPVEDEYSRQNDEEDNFS
jgi:hypothetical protein